MAIYRKSAVALFLCAAFVHADGIGRVEGLVKFPDEAPPRNMYANASDADCPPGIPQTHLLVEPYTRGLQNALIVLGREDRRVMPTLLQAQLSMNGCQLVPRVQWVPLGTSLVLVNKDETLHHLHVYKEDNTIFEVDLPAHASPVRRPLVVPGLYKINCDKHLWERAWIYVSPHDSVAVTDSNGQFTIKNVPVGRYQLLLWHEGWLDKGKDRDGRPEFQPMQEITNVKVRENQESHILLQDLTPVPSRTASN